MGTMTLSRAELERTLRELRQDPRCDNPRISGISIHNQMLARKNGFPKMLHHDTEDPLQVINEDEQNKMEAFGFREQYRFREFPLFLHRRNMDSRFEAKFDAATGKLQLTENFVESREFKTQEDFDRAMSLKLRSGEGPWMRTLGEIEPLPDINEDDLILANAKLSGQLAEARRIAGDDTPIETRKKRKPKAA